MSTETTKRFTFPSSKDYPSISEEDGTSNDEDYLDARDACPRRIIDNKPSFSNQPGPSRLRNQTGATGRGTSNYEILCASSLRLGVEPKQNISPKLTHIQNNWGKTTRNWSIWTGWSSRHLKFPTFPTDRFQDILCEFRQEDFCATVNYAFEKAKLQDKCWTPIENDYLAVQISNQHFHEQYLPVSQVIELDAMLLDFEEDLRQPKRYTCWSTPVKILAYAGLAQVLLAILNPLDILIIEGGHTYSSRVEGLPILILNMDREHHTRIVRLPQHQIPEITLFEKIAPRPIERRYKMTYKVKSGKYSRVVERHRTFDEQIGLCRKVTDTLAYNRVRWEFPFPIVRNADPCSLYKLFMRRDFEMSPLPSQRRSSSSNRKSKSKSQRRRRCTEAIYIIMSIIAIVVPFTLMFSDECPDTSSEQEQSNSNLFVSYFTPSTNNEGTSLKVKKALLSIVDVVKNLMQEATISPGALANEILHRLHIM